MVGLDVHAHSRVCACTAHAVDVLGVPMWMRTLVGGAVRDG
jgi:hypothetical protein